MNSFGRKNNKGAIIEGKPKVVIDNNPGVGYYELDDKDIKKNKNSLKIGNAIRQSFVPKRAIEIPGPGKYENDITKSFGKNAQKAIISKRSERDDRTLSPGPGAYNNDLSKIKAN